VCEPVAHNNSPFRYSPPELISIDQGNALVKEFHVTPEGECKANGTYELVEASIAHDMWSLGAVMYELFTNETLFHGNSVSDNIDQDELPILAEWTDEIKFKKLLKVPNISVTNDSNQPNYARNLLSLLLMKNPAARPRSISHVLAHPLFHDGNKPGRLLGEPAKYDFFLSYRVSAALDANLLEGIYSVLKERGYRVFWDKLELHKGREWEKEFCEGLVCSHVFVPLLSQAAIKNLTNERANFEALREESACDNVLLEHRLALELKDRGYIKSILPLLIGQCTEGVFDKFKFDQLPAASKLPKVQVRALESKLKMHLDNHGLGTP
jgi:serine/threonine protein kinase